MGLASVHRPCYSLSIDLVGEIDMTFGQQIRQSYREFQQRWTDLADSAFGKAMPANHDEMARGEFISPFITERGLSFPRPDRETPRG
jgi:hypothetical protein